MSDLQALIHVAGRQVVKSGVVTRSVAATSGALGTTRQHGLNEGQTFDASRHADTRIGELWRAGRSDHIYVLSFTFPAVGNGEIKGRGEDGFVRARFQCKSGTRLRDMRGAALS
ncbi:MAG: hypothetical protein KDJ19_03030 [Hyphomicrobiaceae bacterium]|nr:hypothetical protein [Hyphomicrobiaceae bacterium]